MRYKASKQLQIQMCKHQTIWQDHSFHAGPQPLPWLSQQSQTPSHSTQWLCPTSTTLDKLCILTANHTLSSHPPPTCAFESTAILSSFQLPKGRNFPPPAPGKSLSPSAITSCLLNHLRESITAPGSCISRHSFSSSCFLTLAPKRVTTRQH